jgi:hypothetical protein
VGRISQAALFPSVLRNTVDTRPTSVCHCQHETAPLLGLAWLGFALLGRRCAALCCAVDIIEPPLGGLRRALFAGSACRGQIIVFLDGWGGTTYGVLMRSLSAPGTDRSP